MKNRMKTSFAQINSLNCFKNLAQANANLNLINDIQKIPITVDF